MAYISFGWDGHISTVLLRFLVLEMLKRDWFILEFIIELLLSYY